MGDKSSVQTFLLTITVLPPTGRGNLRQAVHNINTLLDQSNAKIVYKFKVSGEPKILTILDISDNNDLENLVESMWNLGSIEVISSPVLHYPIFARNLGVADELVNLPLPKLDKDYLYWIDCDIEYHGKTVEELLKIWKSEAEGVLTFRKLGTSNLIPFKSLGQRKITAFVNQPRPGELDKLTFELPIVVENGNNVHMKNKAIQLLDEYIKANPL